MCIGSSETTLKATSLGMTFSFLPSISISKTFDKNVSELTKFSKSFF